VVALAIGVAQATVAASPEPASTPAVPCQASGTRGGAQSAADPAPEPSAATAADPGASIAAPQFPDIDDIIDPTEPPIDLAVTVECDTTVTATIPLEGGEMVATGADGTVYTLTIPDDALLAETTVSMTPVAAVAGLPTSGEVTYAVQLEPSGLELFDFATLTIEPVDELSIDEQIPFGYEGSGEGMFVALPAIDDPGITIRILHFSGYGVTKGLLADLEPYRKRLGGDAQARLESQTALELARLRQLAQQGKDDDPASQAAFLNYFFDALERFTNEVIAPRMLAAGESCANARLALVTVMGVQRQQQLLGMESMETPAGLPRLAGHICMQEEYELCRDEHIIHRVLGVMLAAERQRQLQGIDDPGELAFAKDLARKCLTFELAFESSISIRIGALIESDVESKVKLTMDPDSFVISGKAPLKNTKIKLTAIGPNHGCVWKTERGGSTFTVSDLRWNVAYGPEDDPVSTTVDPVGHVEDFVLTFKPGQTTEGGKVICPKIGAQKLPVGDWTGTFLGAHAGDLQWDDSLKMSGWEVNDRAERLGTKEWDVELSSITDEGSLELHHTPQ
jgi:hypothetical protein